MKGKKSGSNLFYLVTKAKIKAFKNSPPGVYVIEYNLKSNTKDMAGYVGFSTFGDLHRLFPSAEAEKILNPWKEPRSNSFGISGRPANALWTQAKAPKMETG